MGDEGRAGQAKGQQPPPPPPSSDTDGHGELQTRISYQLLYILSYYIKRAILVCLYIFFYLKNGSIDFDETDSINFDETKSINKF